MKHAAVVLGVVLLTAVSASALAGVLAGITMPETATVGDTTLALNGMGLRKKLMIKVYVGALYLPARSRDVSTILATDAPMRMVMHFLYKEVEAAKVTEAWTEGFANNSPADAAALQPALERFNSWWPTMRSGDEAVMTYVPGAGTTLEINGKAIGTIEGRPFARALLAVWLGDEPPDKGLRAGILGL